MLFNKLKQHQDKYKNKGIGKGKGKGRSNNNDGGISSSNKATKQNDKSKAALDVILLQFKQELLLQLCIYYSCIFGYIYINTLSIPAIQLHGQLITTSQCCYLGLLCLLVFELYYYYTFDISFMIEYDIYDISSNSNSNSISSSVNNWFGVINYISGIINILLLHYVY